MRTRLPVLMVAVVLSPFLVGQQDAWAAPVVAVSATASADDGNVPANAIDGVMATRWSAEGDGQWLRLDLAAPRRVTSVAIAWHKGDQRKARYDVEASVDGESWLTIHGGRESSGTTLAPECTIVWPTDPRYVRIVGHGNSSTDPAVSGWNSIAEVTVYDTPDCDATPPPSGFPNERNTGVPAGITLRPSGGLTVTTPGTVLDALDISGSVVVDAANVTIKRSRISAGSASYPIRVLSGNVVVVDTEISGGRSAAVCCGNFVLRRVNIHDVFEGPRLNGNVTVEDSYLHHLARCDGCHVDVLQTTGGTGITIRRNNLQAYNPALQDPMNAAFMFGEETAPVRDCLVEGNLLNGGNYTVNGGGGGTTGAQCTIRNNKFQRDFRYGPAANIHSGNQWDSSNIWYDTGLPVL